jgi:hypothetical protein
MGNDSGFSAAGTGEDEERTFHEPHRLPLWFVQAFEKVRRDFGFHGDYYNTTRARAADVKPAGESKPKRRQSVRTHRGALRPPLLHIHENIKAGSATTWSDRMATLNCLL